MKLSHKVLPYIIPFIIAITLVSKLISCATWLEFFLLVTTSLVFVLVLNHFIFKDISKRLFHLSMDIEEMAAGNFKKRFKTSKKDEIGQLSNVIEELKIKLKTGVAIDASKDKELDRVKTDFVTIASHQLRTPLSIIKWYSDFLIAGDAGETTKEQSHILREIYFSNERLIELVNALLDVSRIDLGTFSIDPEPFVITEAANEALERYEKELEKKKITVKKDFSRFGKINLDPRLTKMIFENLISNSMKYTPEGGRINISIKKTEKNIYIKVSDSGVGIPKEQHLKIFSKMFRADNARKIEAGGTGLGLYIIKAIIETSGGKIWFESPSLDLIIEKENKNKNINKEKMGTTFFVTIPIEGMKKRKGTKKIT